MEEIPNHFYQPGLVGWSRLNCKPNLIINPMVVGGNQGMWFFWMTWFGFKFIRFPYSFLRNYFI